MIKSRLIKTLFCLNLIMIFLACNKTEFLEKKPNTNLVIPKTLDELRALLENEVTGRTGSLAQIACDDYSVTDADFLGVSTSTERNSYIWAKNIYGGEIEILDWNKPYQGIFYANNVLEGLSKNNQSDTDEGRFIKGWALFIRAYANYDLAKNFCKAYDASTVNSDPGIPLRLLPNIDYIKSRATLKETFDQIITDLIAAQDLLPLTRTSTNINRPSKIAVFALFSRIYLDMRNYAFAEEYATKCLNLYNTLIDYNTINKTATSPFVPSANPELIYFSAQVSGFSEFTGQLDSRTSIAPNLISLYDPNDLRLVLYFTKRFNNTRFKKRGYTGTVYPFTGLATDEVLLIKAECLARKGDVPGAIELLNTLLIKRWDPNATVPAKPFIPITAVDQQDAINKVLLERRKELVWRGLRWHDLKRLNKEGANITLTRVVNGVTYTLPPNDPRYVFPIPDDEIALSGIAQNPR